MLSTAVANSTETATFPIRHRLAGTDPASSGLESWGEANAHILVTGLAERELSSHNHDYDYSALVGRIMPVRPSRPNREQWYLSELDHEQGGAYLTGALVNPTPVNGRVYQELLPYERVNMSPFYLRYNDEAHAEDRAQSSNPWTIVWAQDELAREIGHARVVQPTIWVEVQWPLVSAATPVTTGLASDEDIELILTEEEVPVPAPLGFITNSVIGHTLGKAHTEADGNVLLDPPLVRGEMYLTWYDGTTWYDDHAMVQVAVSDERLVPVGYYNRGVDSAVYFHDDLYYDERRPGFGAPTSRHWAKLGWESPASADDAEERKSRLLTQAEESHEAFENLNDALNNMAEDEGWCSEYERTMQEIGMRDRRSGPRRPFDPGMVGAPAQPERHAYDVQYDVEVTITDDAPSHRVTGIIESEYGLYSVSELRFDANLTVTISGVVADSADDAENLVSQFQIEEEVGSMLGDASFELNDYSHSDTSEDHNFDWEEYDENN